MRIEIEQSITLTVTLSHKSLSALAQALYELSHNGALYTADDAIFMLADGLARDELGELSMALSGSDNAANVDWRKLWAQVKTDDDELTDEQQSNLSSLLNDEEGDEIF